MLCQFCGRENTAGSANCSYCGEKLEVRPRGGKYGHDLTKLKAPSEIKNPKVASMLGFLLGWILLGPVGYIYLGQWNWFWITFILQFFAYPLTGIVGAYMILPFIYLFHQYDMAKDVNKLVESSGREKGEDRVAETEEAARAD